MTSDAPDLRQMIEARGRVEERPHDTSRETSSSVRYLPARSAPLGTRWPHARSSRFCVAASTLPSPHAGTPAPSAALGVCRRPAAPPILCANAWLFCWNACHWARAIADLPADRPAAGRRGGCPVAAGPSRLRGCVCTLGAGCRMTEADTCRKFVVPKLQAAGWETDPHSIAEQRTITDGRIVPGRQGLHPQAAQARRLSAPLHARFPARRGRGQGRLQDPADGLQQAKEYARCSA